MLYLEDYLELIEHLPQELRDRFTDIREKDLQVQNSSGNLQEKNELFFAEAKKLKPEQRQCEYEKLLKEYEKSLSYAEEKVDIATSLCEIMQKLVNRLDNEMDKFKVELEASSSSICERAALIAGGDSIHLNGLSMSSTRASSVCSDTNGNYANGGHYENNLSSFGNNNNSFKHSSSLHTNHKSNLENISANLTSNNSNVYNNSALGSTLASANKPNLNSALAMMYAASVQNQKISGNTTLYNRNETKYCLCRQISYGEMVACDNNECEFEWFHYDCVNITRPPKGKWYCPNCLPKMDGHNQNHQHLTSTTS